MSFGWIRAMRARVSRFLCGEALARLHERLNSTNGRVNELQRQINAKRHEYKGRLWEQANETQRLAKKAMIDAEQLRKAWQNDMSTIKKGLKVMWKMQHGTVYTTRDPEMEQLREFLELISEGL